MGPWNNNGRYMKCNKSFVFSLTRMKKYGIKKEREKTAIGCEKELGAVFGYDLCIANDCNINSTNFCCLGDVYNTDETHVEGGQLAGSKLFMVDEIEAYS